MKYEKDTLKSLQEHLIYELSQFKGKKKDFLILYSFYIKISELLKSKSITKAS
jgi:hypothetical protein